MAGLGPLFGTRPMKGPIVVCYLQTEGRDIYLIGEKHTVNGTFESDMDKHAVSQIAAYDNPVTLCTELTFLQMQNWSYYCSEVSGAMGYYGKSPMYTCGYFLFNRKLKETHSTIPIDSRKAAPYDIYTMIVDPELYCFEHYIQNYSAMLPQVRLWAKQAERSIINNMQTRKKAMAFLESLYMPGLDYPGWYKALHKTITSQDISSPLRDRMSALREKKPDVYEKLVQHMRSYYQRWARTPYTIALGKIQKERRTLSPRLVRSKNKDALDLFVELTSYLLDLNFILEVYLSENKTVCLLAGLAHVEGICRFFNKETIHMKMDKDGNMPEGHAVHGVPGLANRIPSLLKRLAKNKSTYSIGKCRSSRQRRGPATGERADRQHARAAPAPRSPKSQRARSSPSISCSSSSRSAPPA